MGVDFSWYKSLDLRQVLLLVMNDEIERKKNQLLSRQYICQPKETESYDGVTQPRKGTQ